MVSPKEHDGVRELVGQTSLFSPNSCFVSGKNRTFCVEFPKVFKDITQTLQGKGRKTVVLFAIVIST